MTICRFARMATWLLAAQTLLGCAATQHEASHPPTAQAAWIVLPALQKEMQTVVTAMQLAGLHAGGPALAGFLLSGNHATLPIKIPAEQCMTIASRATRGARDVDAALYSAEGTLLALDSEPDAHPSLQACAAEGETRVYYVIQFYDGDGSFLAVPFFGPRSTLHRAAAALGGNPAFAEIVTAPEVGEDAVSAFSEGMRKRGYAAVGEPQRFEIAEGERVRENLPVEPGKCYTVAAFGGSGVSELSLRVMDDHGVELSASGEGQAHAATQLCARANATYALESAARAGAGQVLLFVYRVDVMTAGGDAGLWLGKRASLH
jgi:hypothetical protein